MYNDTYIRVRIQHRFALFAMCLLRVYQKRPSSTSSGVQKPCSVFAHPGSRLPLTLASDPWAHTHTKPAEQRQSALLLREVALRLEWSRRAPRNNGKHMVAGHNKGHDMTVRLFHVYTCIGGWGRESVMAHRNSETAFR